MEHANNLTKQRQQLEADHDKELNRVETDHRNLLDRLAQQMATWATHEFHYQGFVPDHSIETTLWLFVDAVEARSGDAAKQEAAMLTSSHQDKLKAIDDALISTALKHNIAHVGMATITDKTLTVMNGIDSAFAA